MRILLNYGLIGRGGDAIQVLEMAQAFRNLGHDVDLVGPIPLRPYDFSTTEGRLRNLVRRLPWWAKDFAELSLQQRLAWMVKRTLSQRRFNLIFHRASIYDFVGPQLAAMTETPVVVHLDAPFSIEREFHGSGHFARFHRRCMRRLGQSAHLVVTVSAVSRDYYVNLGISPEKILVLPNGIPFQLLQEAIGLAKIWLPFTNPHTCTIGFVGSLSRWHRVDLLLQALYDLEEQYRVVIVGYGAEYARLQVLAKGLGMEGRIDWLGAMPHNRAVREIARFDIAVLPGTLTTGAPIKLFEYAAFARPIIIPDLPNLRALFGEDMVRFVPPENSKALAEAIRSLYAAPDEARQLGLKAQERVREYTWENIIQRLLEVVHTTAPHDTKLNDVRPVRR